MKPTTHCYITCTNVGTPADSRSFDGPMREMLTAAGKWWLESTMNKELVIKITRKPQTEQTIDDQMAELLADVGIDDYCDTQAEDK